MSTGLLKICRDRNSQVLRANALQLPFRDECFHAVICIAVLHHVSTKVVYYPRAHHIISK